MIHTWALERHGLLLEHDVRSLNRELSNYRYGFYIDAYFSLGTGPLKGNISLSNNLAICETLNLSITRKMTVSATQEPTRFLGIEIDGTVKLRPRNDKMVELVNTTIVICRQKMWKVKQLQQILGSWA